MVRADRSALIAAWAVEPNENNAVLAAAPKRSASRPAHRAQRKGCGNIGYCGMGCPIDAKQSMLVTTIRQRSNAVRTFLTRARASSSSARRPRTALDVRRPGRPGTAPTARRITCAPSIRRRRPAPSARRRCSCAAGCRIRKARGQAHVPAPDVVSAALMPERVDGFRARRSRSTPTTSSIRCRRRPIGYKLEAPPLHPILAAMTLPATAPRMPGG